jgi:hypothetical protein
MPSAKAAWGAFLEGYCMNIKWRDDSNFRLPQHAFATRAIYKPNRARGRHPSEILIADLLAIYLTISYGKGMSHSFWNLEAQVDQKYWDGYSLAKDEERAEELFLGQVIKNSKTGRSSDEYPTRDSSREREAFAALARLLRYSSPPRIIWVMLRHALDPDGPSERRLVFKMRKKGRRPHRSADSQVALSVLSKTEKGYKTEAAVQEAMKEYKLSRKAVFEVVRRFRRRMSGRKQSLCR